MEMNFPVSGRTCGPMKYGTSAVFVFHQSLVVLIPISPQHDRILDLDLRPEYSGLSGFEAATDRQCASNLVPSYQCYDVPDQQQDKIRLTPDPLS